MAAATGPTVGTRTAAKNCSFPLDPKHISMLPGLFFGNIDVCLMFIIFIERLYAIWMKRWELDTGYDLRE